MATGGGDVRDANSALAMVKHDARQFDATRVMGPESRYAELMIKEQSYNKRGRRFERYLDRSKRVKSHSLHDGRQCRDERLVMAGGGSCRCCTFQLCSDAWLLASKTTSSGENMRCAISLALGRTSLVYIAFYSLLLLLLFAHARHISSCSNTLL